MKRLALTKESQDHFKSQLISVSMVKVEMHLKSSLEMKWWQVRDLNLIQKIFLLSHWLSMRIRSKINLSKRIQLLKIIKTKCLMLQVRNHHQLIMINFKRKIWGHLNIRRHLLWATRKCDLRSYKLLDNRKDKLDRNLRKSFQAIKRCVNLPINNLASQVPWPKAHRCISH